MTGAEIAALGWLAMFVNTALGGLTDRLKRRPSSERAREDAFDLYERLASLRLKSSLFVESLRGVSEGISGAEDELNRALQGVAGELKNLERALRQVDPQLEVHVPETAQEINDARMSRALVVSRAEANLGALARGEENVDFSEIVADAERAQEEIEAAAEGLRVFLKNEFSFKESFPG